MIVPPAPCVVQVIAGWTVSGVPPGDCTSALNCWTCPLFTVNPAGVMTMVGATRVTAAVTWTVMLSIWQLAVTVSLPLEATAVYSPVASMVPPRHDQVMTGCGAMIWLLASRAMAWKSWVSPLVSWTVAGTMSRPGLLSVTVALWL